MVREIDFSKHEKTIYSESGEDGVLFKIFNLYGTTNKYYVEFGCESGNCQNNTYALRKLKNFSGLLMDCNYGNLSINLHKHFVTKDNVIDLFKKYDVPYKFDLLSLDIDGHDFYVLNEILNIYTPRVLVCEYNSCHNWNEDKVVLESITDFYKPCFTKYFGATLLSFYNLGKKYNYSLVYATKKGVNCFFIHNDVIKSKNFKIKNINNVEKIYNFPKYRYGEGNHKFGPQEDPLNRKYTTSEIILNNIK